jgi:hypothetical protein
MKVEINRLLTTGADVRISTGHSEWCFYHSGADIGPTLKCHIKPSPYGYCGHTSVLVCRAFAGVERPLLLTPDRHLFLLEEAQCARFKLGSLEILRDAPYAGAMYVKGNFVCVSVDKLPGMGLNYVGSSAAYPRLAFGRDRISISTRLLVLMIPEQFGRATQEMLRLQPGERKSKRRQKLQDLAMLR